MLQIIFILVKTQADVNFLTDPHPPPRE